LCRGIDLPRYSEDAIFNTWLYDEENEIMPELPEGLTLATPTLYVV
jgi:hypothetical protein